MQAHLTSNKHQQNTLEIQHQTKFYLDTRRSHIPESKQAKFQQLKWAEQGDRKIRAQEQQEHGFELSGRVWLGERKREGAGLPFGGPGGTHATWGRGPHPCRAELWHGSMVGPPGQPQVLPRCKMKNRNSRKTFRFF